MNHLPPSSENNIRVISNFFENSRRYLQVKVHRGTVAVGINDTGGKFATGINDTGSKFCHQFCLCQRRRWQLATGINDTGGKFATGVVDTGGN